MTTAPPGVITALAGGETRGGPAITKHTLFTRLCALADALQAEIAREDDSPHQLALSAVVDQLDVLIDEVADADIIATTREPLLWDLPVLCAERETR